MTVKVPVTMLGSMLVPTSASDCSSKLGTSIVTVIRAVPVVRPLALISASPVVVAICSMVTTSVLPEVNVG